jgi:cyclophilin family peptidyl-prolyl cis-trans isomerase
MRWLTRKFKALLPQGARAARRWPRTRLVLEALEDRAVPAANASGTLTGTAFIDANANGVFDGGEPTLPGIVVNLNGQTSQGTAVNVTATTAANGVYTFLNVIPGTYQLSAAPSSNLMGGSPSFGASAATQGEDVVPNLTVGGGQTVTQNLGFLGFGPTSISLREFLTTTTAADFPFPAPGSGQGSAGPRPNNAPTVAAPIGNISVGVSASPAVLDLAGVFSDPDTTDSQVALSTSAGTINVELFDKQAPRTVANFLNYINSGAYNNSIFHRLAINPPPPNGNGLPFVLQGGGFTYDAANRAINTIPTDPPVQNEPDPVHRSNLAGTLAMAKLGNDPNSATDQFFFNLADNSSNLNNQNGGFTVFGKIMGQADQQVLNTLTSATVSNQSSFNSAFDTIPLNNYTGTRFPTDTIAANFDLIQSARVVSQSEKLTYSVLSNSNPGLVPTAVVNNRLTLTYAKGQSGQANITVRATDEFGATVDDTFHVSVVGQPPTTTVTLNTNTPRAGDKLTATAVPADPGGNPVTLTYVWKVNGAVMQTTPSTANKTDTFDLSLPGHGKKGDTITVTVTPSDGVLTGTAATATATVADSPPSTALTLSSTLPRAGSTLTATVTPTDPDGDPVTLTYVWTVNGGVVQTTPGTASKADTFDLSLPGHGKAGDTITVTVTPNDGTLNGSAASATAKVDSPPVVSTPIANVTAAKSATPSPINIDLAAHFTDPDMTDSQVVFNTDSGPINVELFDTQAPQTVANFLDYIKSGAFTNAIFNRLMPGFVLQGGAFTFNASNTTLNPIPTGLPVPNEPDPVNRSNLVGTIAMAKQPNDPNSATSQFFFNLADNSQNLNNQNGGFTVFGKIVSPADQAVITTLASAPVKDESKGDPNSPFTDIPLKNYNGTNFFADTTAANYDLINNVQVVKQTEALTYSLVSNSNPALVTASLQNERLTLTYAANMTGTATITVQATDKAGASTSTSFTVTIS